MVTTSQLLLFALAALLLVLTPGPNMIYLISRSLSQGKKAGLISLAGVVSGFLFHILMVSFGLTAIFFAIPYAYATVKMLGVGYLLYLAVKSLQADGNTLFFSDQSLKTDSPRTLFQMGFLTNVLNPKMAFFYLSFFPQFIKPGYGNIFLQSLQLGLTQIMISFCINFLLVIFAARMAGWLSGRPVWIKMQKRFMAGIFTILAVKMALTKAK
jgi:threonine/homoserine/homoserine lactone efflux protein